MSSLQVDAIASMGGGHVDGAGLVVQFKSQEYRTKTDIAADTSITLFTIPNFQPLFSDSLIHFSVCHQQDYKSTPTSYCSSYVQAGGITQAAAYNFAYNDTGILGQRCTISYNGTGSSWGTTAKDISLKMDVKGGWTACYEGASVGLYIWEIAQ